MMSGGFIPKSKRRFRVELSTKERSCGFIPKSNRRLRVEFSTAEERSCRSIPKSKRRLRVEMSTAAEERSCGFISKSKRVRGEFSTQQQSSSSSSFTYSYLPDELVEKILHRLPVRSILRFRCVSKSWCALFKTDTFIKNHKGSTMLLLNRPNHSHPSLPPNDSNGGFSFHNLDSPEEEELHPYIPTTLYENLLGGGSNNKNLHTTLQLKGIHGSVNGIICLCYHSFGKRYYILCNLALRQFKLLPPCLSVRIRTHQLVDTLDGFGVSNNTHGFKVITMQVFMYKDYTFLVIAHVYDSGSDSWREVKNVPMRPRQPINFSGEVIYFNGACHWPAETFSAKFMHGRRRGILSFDMTSEIFRHLEVPDCLQGSVIDIAEPLPVVVVDNCLALVHAKMYPIDPDPVEIWVMKEYGVKESWTKLFVISPQPYVTVFLPWKGDMLMVEDPWRKVHKEILEGILQGTISRNDVLPNVQLTSVKLRTDEMKRFKIFGPMFTTRALIYEESLVSLY